MSSILLVNGATRAIKLVPNNTLIPAPISKIDNLFDISLLSDAKFADWKALATAASKIAIVDSEVEVSRFIDSDYDISTPVGNLWFSGASIQDKSYFILTGSALSKSNSSETFTDSGTDVACALLEASGVNFANRCSAVDGHLVNVSYEQSALLDKGVGMNGSDSVVTFNEEPIPINGAQKFSIKCLMKQTVLGVLSIWIAQGTAFLVMIQDVNNLIFSIDSLTFTAKIDPSAILASDTFFLLDIIFDGTQTGNANRFKVYINKALQSLVFTGDVPASYPDTTGISFDFGLSGLSYAGVLDEIRMKWDEVESSEEIVNHYNQWFDKATFWVPLIQPLIFYIIPLGSGRYQVIGSGFIVGGVDPTGTIGGVAFTIELGNTDTDMIIVEGAGTPFGNKVIEIQNNEGLCDNQIIDDSFHQRFSYSPWSFEI